MKRKERAEQLRIDIPAVFIALGKKETPAMAKVFAAICLVYALSPIDLIPDFIPVLGYLDDVIILPVLIALTIRLIPPAIFTECRTQAEDMWAEGRPKRWYFALPFVALWGLAAYFLLKAIFY